MYTRLDYFSESLLIMTAGIGENYRNVTEQTGDRKPDFDRIVNIISKDD